MPLSKARHPGSDPFYLLFTLTDISYSEKISNLLQDSLRLTNIPYYSVNPMDPVFDCGILELREEILQAMEKRIDEFVAENQELFSEICSHFKS